MALAKVNRSKPEAAPTGLRKSTVTPTVATGLRKGAASSAPEASATPCAGCKGLVLTVKAGSSAGLRAQLVHALVGASNFLLNFFDNMITEASAAPASSTPPSTDRWSSNGMTIDFAPDGPFVVTVEHDSAAYHAGLKAGDRILSLEDVGEIHHTQNFAAAWKLGERWPGGARLLVARGDDHLPIQIARA